LNTLGARKKRKAVNIFLKRWKLIGQRSRRRLQRRITLGTCALTKQKKDMKKKKRTNLREKDKKSMRWVGRPLGGRIKVFCPDTKGSLKDGELVKEEQIASVKAGSRKEGRVVRSRLKKLLTFTLMNSSKKKVNGGEKKKKGWDKETRGSVFFCENSRCRRQGHNSLAKTEGNWVGSRPAQHPRFITGKDDVQKGLPVSESTRPLEVEARSSKGAEAIVKFDQTTVT